VLRTALRQDPDIVLVGEMRDTETMEMGLRAAMTGHLVFSTLHTTNAITTITRLLDMGAEGFLIASSLHGVLAQRLMRRLCDSCAEPLALTTRQQAYVTRYFGPGAAPEFNHGMGCTYCNMTGYRGRIGIYELLEIDATLADAIRGGDNAKFGRIAKKQPGFVSLARRALAYAIEGKTSIEEVMRVTAGLEEDDLVEPLLDDVLTSERTATEPAATGTA
jgi:MSHA biogenesis protein MshE